MIPFAENWLQSHSQMRAKLAESLASLTAICNSIQATQLADQAFAAQELLLDDGFKVLVIGKLKTGKSTLINAMLGQSVLPTRDRRACTAIPVSIVYGEKLEAISKPVDGDPEPYKLPAMLEAFKQTITIPSDLMTLEERESYIHPYESAQIRCPVEWLKHGVTIVDTPGLDEQGGRTQITWDAHKNTDAVVYLPDAERIEEQSNYKHLYKCLELGLDPRSVFIAWNVFGTPLTNNAESRSARAAAYSISDPLGIPRQQVCFLSALNALAARVGKRNNDPEQSGLPELERMLISYLCDNPGATKLRTPLNEGKRIIERALHRLPESRARHEKTVDGANRFIEDTDHATAAAHILIQKLKMESCESKALLKERLAREAKLFVGEHLPGIDCVINNAELSTIDAIMDREDTAKQLAIKAKDWLEEQAFVWDKEHIQPLLRGFYESASKRLEHANTELDLIISKLQRSAVQWNVDWEQSSDTTSTDDRQRNHDEHPAPSLMPALSTRHPLDYQSSSVVQGSVGIGLTLAITLSNPIGWVVAAGGVAYGAIKASSNLREMVSQAFRSHLAEYDEQLAAELHKSVEQISAMSGSKEVDALLARISAMRKWTLQAQNICTEQRHKAQTGLLLIEHAEHQLTTLQSHLDETERDLDRVKFSPEVDRIREIKLALDLDLVHDQLQELLGRFQAKGTHSELYNQLDREEQQALAKLRKLLDYQGCWRNEMEGDMLVVWVTQKDAQQYHAQGSSNSRAKKQTFVLRTAIAYALSTQQDLLPDPSDVKSWLDSPPVRNQLLLIYRTLSNGEDFDHRVDKEGRSKQIKDGFWGPYSRALKKYLEYMKLKTHP